LTVFKSLTEKYGNKWRYEVRQDVVGLKWIEKKAWR
jgi:hypothetical protein